jgi:hypothetical protein
VLNVAKNVCQINVFFTRKSFENKSSKSFCHNWQNKSFPFHQKKFSAKLAETVHRSFSIKMVSDGISKMFEIRIRDMPWSRRGPHKIE